MQSIYYVLILAVIVITIISIRGLMAGGSKISEKGELRKMSVSIKNNIFDVEVAETESQRNKGLMYRESLPQNAGMLFIFDKVGIYPFWMKNTLIPLDMVWISESGKITYISENVQPCSNSLEAICKSVIPLSTAKYVLEVNSGVVKDLGIKIGDEVKF